MIKPIDDNKFFALAELYAEYNQCLATKYNKTISTNILLQELSQPKAMALGLYREEELVGFTLGKQHSDKVYRFTAMYIKPKFRYNMRKLFNESEKRAKEMRYEAFISESSTPKGINMHKRMGAIPIEVKFYKEL